MSSPSTAAPGIPKLRTIFFAVVAVDLVVALFWCLAARHHPWLIHARAHFLHSLVFNDGTRHELGQHLSENQAEFLLVLTNDILLALLVAGLPYVVANIFRSRPMPRYLIGFLLLAAITPELPRIPLMLGVTLSLVTPDTRHLVFISLMPHGSFLFPAGWIAKACGVTGGLSALLHGSAGLEAFVRENPFRRLAWVILLFFLAAAFCQVFLVPSMDPSIWCPTPKPPDPNADPIPM